MDITNVCPDFHFRHIPSGLKGNLLFRIDDKSTKCVSDSESVDLKWIPLQIKIAS